MLADVEPLLEQVRQPRHIHLELFDHVCRSPMLPGSDAKLVTEHLNNLARVVSESFDEEPIGRAWSASRRDRYSFALALYEKQQKYQIY